MKKVLIFIIGLLLTGATLMAQDDFTGPMDPDRREQMESLRIWKMTEFLDLTPEQAKRFFPRLKEYEARIHENMNKQRDIMKKIYELGKDKDYKATDKEVKEYAWQLANLEKDIAEQKAKFVIDIGDVLTENQQLKFIVFDNRFRNRLMRSIYQPSGHRMKSPRKERN